MLPLLFSLILTTQTPQPPVVGIWKLQTVSVSGKPVKDLSGILKDFGGLEPGAEWKFRDFEDDNGGCSLNGADCGYEYVPRTRELVVDRETKDLDVKQVFDVKIVGKLMKLRYKQDKKPVELTFSKEE